ncbi:sigma-70 family RNA polymerase sigma factor [soil metagenome]
MDDHALARALVARDGQAFGLLVERETRYVFRICYRVLGQVDEAEDATQETFLLAYRALGTFRGGSPRGWLARIAAREAYRRADARRRGRKLTAPLSDVVVATTPDASDPVGDVLAAEQRLALRQGVSALPEPYREVVSLRFFGELSIADICAATGRPEGTVKSQLYRGLDRLRRQYGEGTR